MLLVLLLLARVLDLRWLGFSQWSRSLVASLPGRPVGVGGRLFAAVSGLSY